MAKIYLGWLPADYEDRNKLIELGATGPLIWTKSGYKKNNNLGKSGILSMIYCSKKALERIEEEYYFPLIKKTTPDFSAWLEDYRRYTRFGKLSMRRAKKELHFLLKYPIREKGQDE